MEQRSGSNRSLAVPSYEGSLCDSVSEKEFRLITEAFQRARVHLVHVVCRAQTHCSRDMLWHRLLVGGIGEEEKDGTKKGRKRSEVRRSGSDYNVKAHWMKGLVTLYPGAEESSASRLSFEEFKQLLSVVVSKSLRDEDPQGIPLLANGALLYLNLFRIITAKFPDTHRVFVGEDSTVHYLAILNADDPDMFVLIHVDEQNDTADMLVVFREDSQPDEGGTSRQPRLLSKKIRRHVYSVVNALCFHLWTSLLQV